MYLMALEPTKESLMATFAQWLRDQSNGDLTLQELQNFASAHAATWPWWSDTRADYEALVQTVQDDTVRERLLRALATYYARWANTAQGTQTFPMRQRLLSFVQDNLANIFLAMFFLVLFLALIAGIFNARFLTLIAGVEQARGLITFLFAFSAILIIALVAVAIFWMEASEIDNRFNRAKDLLTIIIGILGTILGFYYGSLAGGESRLQIANVELSSPIARAGDTVQLSAALVGGTAPYSYEIQFVDRTGVAQTSALTIKSKKSDSGSIVESVQIPAVSKATAIIFTLVASDAKGAQARTSGAIVVEPKSP
jgi:hypothetical protein